MAGIAFTLFGIGFITELAIFMKSPITLAVVGLLWALMMALELAVTGVTIYWIVSLDSLANDQMLTLQVTLIAAAATTTTAAATAAATTTAIAHADHWSAQGAQAAAPQPGVGAGMGGYSMHYE